MPDLQKTSLPLAPQESEAIRERLHKIVITRTLAIKLLSLERGLCTLAIDRDKRYDGIFESIHGGILTTLADSAAAFAVLTLAGPDARITTIEINTRFLRPALERAVAEARVLKLGKSLAFCTIDIMDGKGNLIGHAGTTYMILDKS